MKAAVVISILAVLGAAVYFFPVVRTILGIVFGVFFLVGLMIWTWENEGSIQKEAKRQRDLQAQMDAEDYDEEDAE